MTHKYRIEITTQLKVDVGAKKMAYNVVQDTEVNISRMLDEARCIAFDCQPEGTIKTVRIVVINLNTEEIAYVTSWNGAEWV